MPAASEEKGAGEGIETIRHGRSPRRLWIGLAAIGAVVLIVSYGALSGWFAPQQPITLLGAGATFPYPLISKWASIYANQTGVRVNYQSIGSGGGISQLEKKTVDFAGSDAPLTPSERALAPNALHIPETIGAVTFAYNLPGVAAGLNVTGDVLVGIFNGTITAWNDARIASLNAGVALPGQPITVVHRSDGSGTTFVWTSYLHQVNASWSSTLVGKSIDWPVGIGQPGNSGVAGKIQQTPYAAGYVELAFTVQNSMTVAKVQNPEGAFVLPTLASTAAAAAGAAPSLPSGSGDWGNVSILNAPGVASYPIASFTYLLVYKELNVIGSSMTLAKSQALVNFLWWVVHDGQSYSESLVYVPLPSAVVTADALSINSITYNGQTLHA